MISDISLDFDICIRKPHRFGYTKVFSDTKMMTQGFLYPIGSETISDKKEERRIQEGESMTKEGESMTHKYQKLN